MKYQKYTLSFLFLLMFMIATPSFVLGKTNNSPVRNHSNTFIGVIQSINNDIYTIEVKKGEDISTIDVKFDANTRLNPRDKMNRDMMNNLSPRQRRQNMKNFRGTARQSDSIFKVGDTIQVMGKTNTDNTIEAQSIRKVNLPKVIKNINN